ncbi:VC0807 family protein [Streptomyces sp. DSM 41527]|uniref:VC0807 family protein n=1 Tax=Streptomyces mooreae TaxID=3075523 RepID=A0ABU2TEE3_9ACTN|nr:VC0807 family protein [Streptomyces sp. DSM 41527]MDT0459282.1 VC0807 family protein [Streptomyces sp. DSM 41527]
MNRTLRALLPLLSDLIVPTAVYYLLHQLGVADVPALIAACAATAGYTVPRMIRRRRVDALGLLVIAELAATAGLLAVSGDARLALLRPTVYLTVAAAVFLLSCWRGRPLTYTGATPMATKGDPERTAAYERSWHNSPQMRDTHRRLTAASAAAMLGYAILNAVIVYSFPVSQADGLQKVPGIALILAIMVMLRSRVPRLSRIVDAEQQRSAGAHQGATDPRA